MHRDVVLFAKRNFKQTKISQAVAKPAQQFGHVICKFKSLSLFISLEIDSFYNLQTQKKLHSMTKLSGGLRH